MSSRTKRRPILGLLLCLAVGACITIVLVVVIVALENPSINRAATASGLTAYRYEKWGYIYVTTRHPEYPRYWSSHLSAHVEVGWPFRCVRTNEVHPNELRALPRRSQKLGSLRRPMPLGLVANVGLFGLVLWSAIHGPGILRRRHRLRGGRCPFCGYPAGDASLCSECGRPHGLVAADEPESDSA